MTAALCFIFFLSGAAALVFEALWFRLASLVFGSSVWASSLVLSSFMAGLGLGNALAASRGPRLKAPLRAYAWLEALIGATGFGLVLLLPALDGILAAVFRPVLDRPLLLNPLRLGIAFALMLLPATAMGATLPIVVKALLLRDANFGRVLGRLYGWNTLGAVAGALAVETVLVGPLGLRGSGLAAAALNGTAALCALALARRWTATAAPAAEPEAPAPRAEGRPGRGRRLIAAAALCGATLLALEVVWFRFLQLFVFGSAFNFALMLALVLLGIGAGGAVAGAALGRWPDGHRALPGLALASAFLSALAYVGFDNALAVHRPGGPGGTVVLASWLVLPTSLLSGALFTLIGRALEQERGERTRTTAVLTLANTMGGMTGAFAGGFVLLPALGMERSFFLLSLLYVGVAALSLRPRELTRRQKLALAGAAACPVLLLGLFPFGMMRNHFLKIVRASVDPGAAVAALREGRLETVQYLRQDFLGEPRAFHLLTNGHSMSSTTDVGQRYMRLFVYWAMAVQPRAERALLISYGVGNTAQALTEQPGLRSIDVVDISREILELAAVPYGHHGRHPLEDPRVRVWVEDGRFFLQLTRQQFDLITGEPPPVKMAGVVNLYTQEYFETMSRRLAPGGVATYWLPVYQMMPGEARSIARAFCAAFPDCTLWSAAGLEWMLAGTRGAAGPVDEAAFTRQWSDPRTAPALRAIGLEVPELLGTTFLADASQIEAFLGDAPPLVDDFPQRVSHRQESMLLPYLEWMEPEAARERFAASRFVARTWPPGLRARTLAFFEWQEAVNGHFVSLYGGPHGPGLFDLHRVLARSTLTTLPLWMMGSSPVEAAILERVAARRPADAPAGLAGIALLARRQYAAAAEAFAQAAAGQPPGQRWQRLRVLALYLGGDPAAARNLAEDLRRQPGADRDLELGEWSARYLSRAEG